MQPWNQFAKTKKVKSLVRRLGCQGRALEQTDANFRKDFKNTRVRVKLDDFGNTRPGHLRKIARVPA